jgi:hypothetical protein
VGADWNAEALIGEPAPGAVGDSPGAGALTDHGYRMSAVPPTPSGFEWLTGIVHLASGLLGGPAVHRRAAPPATEDMLQWAGIVTTVTWPRSIPTRLR